MIDEKISTVVFFYVFIRNVCGFSSIILLQSRQNLPKRRAHMLVKTGSYIDDDYIQKAVLFKGSDEAFFNTVTVSSSSIDISPSMCEIY